MAKYLNYNAVRSGFFRKVYGILAVQMLTTVGIAACCMLMPTIRNAFLHMSASENWLFKLGLFIPTMFSLLVLQCGAKNEYPANYMLLSLFTLGIALDVGYVCAVVHGLGYGDLILQAFGVTAMIFVGLSAYAMYSEKDFSYMGAFLSVALWGLVLTGLAGLFFPFMVSNLAYSFIGALTFCGYILYDTWRLQHKEGIDNYIVAAIELYLDIVNLFLYILKILLQAKKKK